MRFAYSLGDGFGTEATLRIRSKGISPVYCFAISSFEDNLRAFLDKANYLCDKACTNTEAMENPRKIQNVKSAIFSEVFMCGFISGRFPIRRCGRGSISSSVLLPVAVSIRSRGFSHGLSRLRACNQFIGWRSVRVLSRNGSRGRRLPIRGRALRRGGLGDFPYRFGYDCGYPIGLVEDRRNSHSPAPHLRFAPEVSLSHPAFGQQSGTISPDAVLTSYHFFS